MDRTLVHTNGEKRIVSREGEVLTVYDAALTQLDEQVFHTELTAKAYEHFVLLHLADMGFKPT